MFFRSILHVPKRYPFAFGAIFSTVKTGAADVLVQTQVEDVRNVDWRRVGVFATFGLVFCGFWQYALFNKIMPRLCPGAVAFVSKSFRQKIADKRGLKELAIQVGIENGINNPLLYFPVFYSIKYMLEQEDFNPINALPQGIDRFSQTWQDDVIAIWKVWIPAQLFNFGFMPMWMRIPFTTIVSFGWTCYLSFARGQPDKIDAGALDKSSDSVNADGAEMCS